MDFMNYIKQGIEIVKLNEKAMVSASKDNDATLGAVLIALVGGVAGAIGTLSFMSIPLNAVFQVIGLFIFGGIIHLLALLFGGKGDYLGVIRPMGLAMVLSWISVIPFIGPMLMLVVGLWSIVVDVMIIKSVHGLSTLKAALCVLIRVIIAMVIALIFVVMVGAAILSAFAGGFA